MKKGLFFITGFLCAIVTTAIVGFFILNDRMSISNGNTFPSEKKADFANLQVVDIDAAKFESILENSKQKTIINFWASWCKPCIQEMPHLLEYCKAKNIQLIFISADKNTKKQIQNLKRQMSQLSIEKTYIIKESSLMDVTGKDSYYSFLKSANIPHMEQNTGIPFLIYIQNGKITKTFNGPVAQELYTTFYDAQIK